jgi:hypothetical protein
LRMRNGSLQSTAWTSEQRWHAIGRAFAYTGIAVVLLVVHVYRRKSMAKSQSGPSALEGLVRVTSEDIRNRQWARRDSALDGSSSDRRFPRKNPRAIHGWCIRQLALNLVPRLRGN